MHFIERMEKLLGIEDAKKVDYTKLRLYTILPPEHDMQGYPEKIFINKAMLEST